MMVAIVELVGDPYTIANEMTDLVTSISPNQRRRRSRGRSTSDEEHRHGRALVLVALVLTGPLASKLGSAIGIGSTAVTVWTIAKWPVLLIVLLFYASPSLDSSVARGLEGGLGWKRPPEQGGFEVVESSIPPLRRFTLKVMGRWSVKTVDVTADGTGLSSRAGTALLALVADRVGADGRAVRCACGHARAPLGP